jgi:hypothetical protein
MLLSGKEFSPILISADVNEVAGLECFACDPEARSVAGSEYSNHRTHSTGNLRVVWMAPRLPVINTRWRSVVM